MHKATYPNQARFQEDDDKFLTSFQHYSYQLIPKLSQSLQCQTFRDWRCLFIDGPSCQAHRQWLSNCCQTDPRFQWSEQKPIHHRIFGAMNQGFQEAQPGEWILFWGSDDWAASSTVLQRLSEAIPTQSQDKSTDLVIAKGRYANAQGQLSRRTAFQQRGLALTSTQQASEESCFLDKHPSPRNTLWAKCSEKIESI